MQYYSDMFRIQSEITWQPKKWENMTGSQGENNQQMPTSRLVKCWNYQRLSSNYCNNVPWGKHIWNEWIEILNKETDSTKKKKKQTNKKIQLETLKVKNTIFRFF